MFGRIYLNFTRSSSHSLPQLQRMNSMFTNPHNHFNSTSHTFLCWFSHSVFISIALLQYWRYKWKPSTVNLVPMLVCSNIHSPISKLNDTCLILNDKISVGQCVSKEPKFPCLFKFFMSNENWIEWTCFNYFSALLK